MKGILDNSIDAALNDKYHEGRQFTSWPQNSLEAKASVSSDWEALLNRITAFLPSSDGLECHVFRIGTYNAAVDIVYRIPYANNTMAVLVINTPHFFDTTFKRWIKKAKDKSESVKEFFERCASNPIKSYFTEKLSQVAQHLSPVRMDIVHDFDFTLNRRPKILMTTCGHVSGAAYFYRPIEDKLLNSPVAQTQTKRSMGLSLHPKYGGHFAYRAVLIFPEILLPRDYAEKPPTKVLKTVQKQKEAIDLFNNNWRDGRYRDCGHPVERYSDLQLKYFKLPPSERWLLIEHWLDEK